MFALRGIMASCDMYNRPRVLIIDKNELFKIMSLKKITDSHMNLPLRLMDDPDTLAEVWLKIDPQYKTLFDKQTKDHQGSLIEVEIKIQEYNVKGRRGYNFIPSSMFKKIYK